MDKVLEMEAAWATADVETFTRKQQALSDAVQTRSSEEATHASSKISTYVINLATHSITAQNSMKRTLDINIALGIHSPTSDDLRNKLRAFETAFRQCQRDRNALIDAEDKLVYAGGPNTLACHQVTTVVMSVLRISGILMDARHSLIAATDARDAKTDAETEDLSALETQYTNARDALCDVIRRADGCYKALAESVMTVHHWATKLRESENLLASKFNLVHTALSEAICSALVANGRLQEGSASQDSRERQSCSICLEAFNPGASVIATNCTHVFHQMCITSWYMQCKREASCPYCRQRI
jgi:hypothetical protein